MADLIHDGPLNVTRHLGPASEGEDRQRWQFTITNRREYVTLRRDEVLRLAESLADSVGEQERRAAG